MDMGIKGRKAIVCAASKGLGKGCAMALAQEGVDLVINARTKAELEATAEEIRKKTGVKVTPIAVDVTTDAGRKQVLAACPEPDIIVNNAGGPPPGDFRNWTRDDWIKAIDANMLTPIELIKSTVDGMMARKFGRIVNITSAAVKAPIDILGLSNGARAGLTGFCAGIARKTVINNVTINGLLPGPFDTDRLRGPVAKIDAEKRGITVDQLLAERAKLNPAGRFGDPEEFGLACAFLCGAKAGFITGQNILLDGGAFPGTL
jgi:3-oxoacyl-[acyl-carrier protein] reductase